MNIRIAIALSIESEQHFYERLLPSTRDELQVIARLDPHQELVTQLRAVLDMCDVVLYDPTLDHGRGLALWSEYSTAPQLICWCSRQEYEPTLMASGAIVVLGPRSTGIDVDVAVRRCKRLLIAKAGSSVMMAKSPGASYTADVVSFPHTRGIEVRPSESIVHIEGQGNYSCVFFVDEPKLLLSRTIGDFEDVLPGPEFVRVHRSHIVNVRHVRRILPGRTPRVQLVNGDQVAVSNRYRGLLLRQLNIIRRK